MNSLSVEEQQLHNFRNSTRSLPGLFASTCPRTKTIVSCNDSLVTTLGHSTAQELLGTPIQNIYHWDCQDLFQYYYNLWLQTGQFEGLGLSLKTREGRSIPIYVQVDSIRDKDEVIRYSKVNYTPLSISQFNSHTSELYQKLRSTHPVERATINETNRLFKQQLGLCSLQAEILKQSLAVDSTSLESLQTASERLVRAASDLNALLIKDRTISDD